MSVKNLQHFAKWNKGKGRHKLITKAIAEAMPDLYSQDGKDPKDVKVVLKLFNPTGIGTWYITEADFEEGLAFGLCDLGYPELGYVSLAELAEFKGRFGLGIERDEHFDGYTLADVLQKHAA